MEQMPCSYTAKGMQKDSGNLENGNLDYYTAVLILGNHSRDLKVHFYEKTCMGIFIAIVFAMALNLNEHKCVSAGEQLTHRVIHMTEGYSAIKGGNGCGQQHV